MFTKIQKTLTHFAYQKARYNPFPWLTDPLALFIIIIGK
jgi:hypothetical protein